MVHAADVAYFAKRAAQSRTAAAAATDISSRISHWRLGAAYEVRAQEATAASGVSFKANIDVTEVATILQMV